jgi:1,4-dihydroxy-2-naphthoate polyprenyltransferase
MADFSWKIWVRAVRVFSLTASMTPVLIGGAGALAFSEHKVWVNFPFFLLSAVCFHAATNLINDYYDFLNGVDTDYSFGSSGVLVGKLLSPRQVRRGAFILFGLGFFLGLPLLMTRGFPILLLGIVGILGGYFYTAIPVGYKYFALGDLLVFLLMGVLLVAGAFFAVTGQVTAKVVILSLPISALVAAILHANNFRDILHDSAAGVKTMASLLGYRWAKIEYYFLIALAYGSVLIMMSRRILSPWAWIIFLTIPLAGKNIFLIQRAQINSPQGIATLDVATAKLHLTFGVLLVISLMLGSFL